MRISIEKPGYYKMNFNGIPSIEVLNEILTYEDKISLSKIKDDIWKDVKSLPDRNIRGTRDNVVSYILGLLIQIGLEVELSKEQHLYFLLDESSGYIKIGKSNNVDKRIKTLNRELSLDLKKIKVLDSCSIFETSLHKLFSDDNMMYKNGREWFFASHKLIRFIEIVDQKNIKELCLIK
jgi:hypothetical protein